MSTHDPEMRDAEALGGLLRDNVHGHASRETDASSFAAVMAGLEQPAPSRRRFGPALALVACVLLLAAVLVLWFERSPAPAPELPAELLASTDAPKDRALRGGGTLRLASHTQASLAELGDDQGIVALTQGKIDLDIPHRDRTRWQVRAGGWRVEVIGTTFSVRLRDGDLEVAVTEGLVRVHNPDGSASWKVAAGETLVRPKGQTARHIPAPPDPALEPPPKAPPAEVVTKTPPPTPEIRRPQPKRPDFSGWPALVDNGDYERVLTSARKAGLKRAYKSARRRELRALADAARYLGNARVERGSLLAMRKRFIKKAEGREAAFLLGRLSEKQNRRPDALRWYQRYTQEAPGGAFADEALGRSVMVLRALGRTEQAQKAATTYLKRFPRGSYRQAASRVASSPP